MVRVNGMANLMDDDIVDAAPWGFDQFGIQEYAARRGEAAPSVAHALYCDRRSFKLMLVQSQHG